MPMSTRSRRRSGKGRRPFISQKAVEAALDTLNYSTGDASEAETLNHLTLVDLELQSPACPPTDQQQLRSIIVNEILYDMIEQTLRRCLHANKLELPALSADVDAVIAHIHTVFARDNTELSVWTYVYYYYLKPEFGWTQQQFADLVGKAPRVLRRYKRYALEKLTEQWITAEWQANRRYHYQRLIHQIPLGKPSVFAGRVAERKQILRALGETYQQMIAVVGGRGMGKTTFVRHLLATLFDDTFYRYLVWVDTPRHADDVQEQLQQTLLTHYSRSDITDVLINHPTIIVIDDVTADVVQSEAWQSLITRLTPATVIITTTDKTLFSPTEMLTVVLAPLQRMDVMDWVVQFYKARRISTSYIEPDVAAIWSKVGGYPQAIDFCLQHFITDDTDPQVYRKAIQLLYADADQQMKPSARRLWHLLSLHPQERLSPDFIEQGIAYGICQRADVATLEQAWVVQHNVEPYQLLKVARQHVMSLYERETDAHLQIVTDDWVRATLAETSSWIALWEYVLLADWLSLSADVLRDIMLKIYQTAFDNGHWLTWRRIFDRHSSVWMTTPELQLAVAICERETMAYRQSAQHLQTLIQACGRAGDFVLQSRAEYHFAVLLRLLGEYQQALSRLIQIEKRPQTGVERDDILYQRARIALDRQTADQALDILGQIQNQTLTVHLLAAEALYQTEAYGDALRTALQCLERPHTERDLIALYNLIGRCHHQQGNYKEAIDFLNAALMIIQKHAYHNLRVSRTQLNLSAVLIDAGEYDEAEDLLDQAEQLNQTLKDRVGKRAIKRNRQQLHSARLQARYQRQQSDPE